MCEHIAEDLMRTGKGMGTNGTCLTWSDRCSKCKTKYVPGNVYRVSTWRYHTPLWKAEQALFRGFEAIGEKKTRKKKSCADVDQTVCLTCSPLTERELRLLRTKKKAKKVKVKP